MAWRCKWQVLCETCDAAGPLAEASAKAEMKAIRKGWLKGCVEAHGIVLHLCPLCAAKPLPDWWPDYMLKP